MSVVLEPSSQLGFNRPLTQVVKKSLIVRNHNNQPVAFKVKTTAPKQYCVRPNSGRIEPGQSVEVSVLLQPMKEEPPASAKCKDKFLVQSTFITPDKESISLADLWNMAEPGAVQQQKIKVVYLPPEGETLVEMEESMDQSRFTDDHPSTYATVRGSPNGYGRRDHDGLSSFVPIHRVSTPGAHERSPSPAQGEYIIAHEDTTHHETHYTGRESPSPGVVNINVHTPTHQTSPHDEMNSKYAEAQDEIGRLKALVASLAASAQNQASELGMRRRNKALTDDGSYVGAESVLDDETVVERSSGGGQVAVEAGVPLQVVIIIALGVFVTTYLFF